MSYLINVHTIHPSQYKARVALKDSLIITILSYHKSGHLPHNDENPGD